jgi:hypothetical protein
LDNSSGIRLYGSKHDLSEMKYKILKSVAHNFSHSFVSYMNYVDHAYVIDDLLKLARNANGERIRIHWIPVVASEQFLTPRVLKSIAQHREWLPEHIHNSGASIEAIREFRTDIFQKPNKQIAVEAYLLDDRGKEHVCNVLF